MEKRWEVTLTHESPEHRDVHTFTFAEAREGAARRLFEGMEACPEVWAGWSFTIGEEA